MDIDIHYLHLSTRSGTLGIIQVLGNCAPIAIRRQGDARMIRYSLMMITDRCARTAGMATKSKRKPERIALRIDKGCLRPADGLSQERLRARGYRVGDVVFCEMKKPRNPGFHRLVHALGKLVAENIEDFEGMSAHSTIKRLQLESNVACDEIAYRINGMSVVQRIPRSLSFESLDDGEFHEVFGAICRHIGKTYWGGLSADEVQAMIELMPTEVA